MNVCSFDTIILGKLVIYLLKETFLNFKTLAESNTFLKRS